MPMRRLLLQAPLILPFGLAACGDRETEPATLPPLVTGYGHLTPLRLNVLEIELADPAPGAVEVAASAPLRPEREMRRMADERLVPVGSEGQARFLVTTARFTRERLPAQGGIGGLFSGEPGERLDCRLVCRLELLSPEGRRVAFVEAEARRSRTLADGASPAARARAAEDVIRQAMDELNVEFEFHIRRTLRGWLAEGVSAPTPAPAEVEREDLQGANRP
jgi:hypothetical protein